MACLAVPVSMLRRRPSGTRRGYRRLDGSGCGASETLVRVVVGKERTEFLVEPFVLEESPFRALIENTASPVPPPPRPTQSGEMPVVLLMDVDSILFEHMLWLMHNDCSSLFRLNLKEIIDFYAQDF